MTVIIGIPVMQYSMHLWLIRFVYRTNLDWWLFAFSASLALGIALTTVILQSWKVALRNPVEVEDMNSWLPQKHKFT